MRRLQLAIRGISMRWQIISAWLFISLLSGCAQTEDLQVSSLASTHSDAGYKRFVIVSDSYKPVDNDLTFEEFARQAKQVLIQKGFIAVDNPKDAQLLVALSYHIGTPKTRTEVVNTPTYPMFGPVYIRHYGYYHPYWNYPVYNTSVYQFTTYQKTMRLQAISAKEFSASKTVKPLWDVIVSSNNENGDLRYMFPYMLVAAGQYIGRNSGYSVSLTLEKNDPYVASLRQINE